MFILWLHKHEKLCRQYTIHTFHLSQIVLSKYFSKDLEVTSCFFSPKCKKDYVKTPTFFKRVGDRKVDTLAQTLSLVAFLLLIWFCSFETTPMLQRTFGRLSSLPPHLLQALRLSKYPVSKENRKGESPADLVALATRCKVSCPETRTETHSWNLADSWQDWTPTCLCPAGRPGWEQCEISHSWELQMLNWERQIFVRFPALDQIWSKAVI